MKENVNVAGHQSCTEGLGGRASRVMNNSNRNPLSFVNNYAHQQYNSNDDDRDNGMECSPVTF